MHIYFIDPENSWIMPFPSHLLHLSTFLLAYTDEDTEEEFITIPNSVADSTTAKHQLPYAIEALRYMNNLATKIKEFNSLRFGKSDASLWNDNGDGTLTPIREKMNEYIQSRMRSMNALYKKWKAYSTGNDVFKWLSPEPTYIDTIRTFTSSKITTPAALVRKYGPIHNLHKLAFSEFNVNLPIVLWLHTIGDIFHSDSTDTEDSKHKAYMNLHWVITGALRTGSLKIIQWLDEQTLLSKRLNKYILTLASLNHQSTIVEYITHN